MKKRVHKILGTIGLILFATLFIVIVKKTLVNYGQVEIYVEDEKGNSVEFVSIEISDESLNVVNLITTDKSGKAVINLPEGKYSYKLIVIPAEYKFDSERISFFVGQGSFQKRKIILSNKKSVLSFFIKDEKQEAVRGVKIQITDKNSCLIDTVITDETGYVQTELMEGSYYYQLVEAPNYLELPKEERFLKIMSSNEYKENLILENKKGTFKIKITSTKNKNRIAGQLFSIYDLNDNHITKMTTDSLGKVEKKLPAGKYYFKLIMAPFKSPYAQKHIEFEVIEGKETIVELDI